MNNVLFAVCVLGGLGAFFGLLLAISSASRPSAEAMACTVSLPPGAHLLMGASSRMMAAA